MAKSLKLGAGKNPVGAKAQLAPDADGGAVKMMAGGAIGLTKVVPLGVDDKALLHARYAPFKVEIVDIDVVLVFEDGTKIVIPGMALAVFSGRKALLVFDDKEIDAESTFSQVGEIKEQPLPLKLALSSAASEKPTDGKSQGDKAEDGGAIQAKDASVQQQAAQAKEENQHKSDGEAQRLTEKISNTQSSSAGSSNSPPSARAIQPAPDDAIGEAGIGKLVPKLTFTLYNQEGGRTGTENGQTIVTGATGAEGSSKDAQFAAQSAKERITGTSANDVIRADDPKYAPSGASARALHVEALVPTGGLTLTTVLIPSLPAGYSIANATLTDKGWLVSIDRKSVV